MEACAMMRGGQSGRGDIAEKVIGIGDLGCWKR